MLTRNKASIGLENMRLAEMSAPDRLLVLLKRGGPSTTAQLGARLGITGEAARQQLLRLQEEGLIEATSAVRGRGRPHQVWKLTTAANRRFPDSHAELTAQLIQTIRRTMGDQALERLIDARAEELLGSYSAALSDATDLRKRLERLVSLRNAEGYMAECRSAKGGFLLIENHCPICAASGVCLKLCRSEQDLFSKLLGPKVAINREEHIVNGSRRCVYRVQLKSPKAASKKPKVTSS